MNVIRDRWSPGLSREDARAAGIADMERIHQAYVLIQPEVEERRPGQPEEKRAAFQKITTRFLMQRDRLARAEQLSRWVIRGLVLSFPVIVLVTGVMTGVDLRLTLLVALFTSAVLLVPTAPPTSSRTSIVVRVLGSMAWLAWVMAASEGPLLPQPALSVDLTPSTVVVASGYACIGASLALTAALALYELRNSTRRRLLAGQARDELLCELTLALVDIAELDRSHGHGDVDRDRVMKRLGTILEMARSGKLFRHDAKDLKRESDRVRSAFCGMVSTYRKMLVAPDKATWTDLQDKLAKMATVVFLRLDGELVTMANNEQRPTRLFDRFSARFLRTVLIAFIPLANFALLNATYGIVDAVKAAVLPTLLFWASAILILAVDPTMSHRMPGIGRLLAILQPTAPESAADPQPEPDPCDQPSDSETAEPSTPDDHAATENRA